MNAVQYGTRRKYGGDSIAYGRDIPLGIMLLGVFLWQIAKYMQ